MPRRKQTVQALFPNFPSHPTWKNSKARSKVRKPVKVPHVHCGHKPEARLRAGCPPSRRAKPEHGNRKEDVRAPESSLLSCQPGTAKPRAGQGSLVCWRHLPWKPKAPGPGPVVPRQTLASERHVSMPWSSKPGLAAHGPSWVSSSFCYGLLHCWIQP